MKFHTIFYVLAAVVSTALAAVADVLDDIRNIANLTQSLDTIVVGFPITGGSLLTALSIHTDLVNLGQAIDESTADIKAISGTLSEADGRSILTGVEGIQITILDSLTEIVEKKAAFALGILNGGIPALLLTDLQNLNSSTSAFEAALIAIVSADLQAQAASIKSSVDAALFTAITAYSS